MRKKLIMVVCAGLAGCASVSQVGGGKNVVLQDDFGFVIMQAKLQNAEVCKNFRKNIPALPGIKNYCTDESFSSGLPYKVMYKNKINGIEFTGEFISENYCLADSAGIDKDRVEVSIPCHKE